MGAEMMVIGGIMSAASTLVGAMGQASAMSAQAEADQKRAAIEAQWATRKANEERGAGQAAAAQKIHEQKLAQSRLTALAADSGGSATDPTVLKLMGDIEGEGKLNAGRTYAEADQKAQGMEYQSALNSWTADANARIKKSAAKTTLIGGILGAGGQLAGSLSNSRMSQRYGGSTTPSYRYG